MSTSNSYVYTETTSQVINDAMSFLGKLAEGDTLSPSEYNLALRTLNRMCKLIIKKGDSSPGMRNVA